MRSLDFVNSRKFPCSERMQSPSPSVVCLSRLNTCSDISCTGLHLQRLQSRLRNQRRLLPHLGRPRLQTRRPHPQLRKLSLPPLGPRRRYYLRPFPRRRRRRLCLRRALRQNPILPQTRHLPQRGRPSRKKPLEKRSDALQARAYRGRGRTG